MPTNKGFDCATPLTASLAALFFSQGYSFVGRYLSRPGSWKRLSPTEARVINDVGLWIVSIFERDADRASKGAAAGSEDGKMALELAREVEQPEGSTIYFAVDYDAGPQDFDAIEAYMRAADKEIDGYELGIYGSYRVVEAMRLRGVTTKLWQTYAWSKGLRTEHAGLYQFQNDIRVNGIGIDLNESNGDAGGWNMLKPQQTPVPQLPESIANNIIDSYLSENWNQCEAARQAAINDGRTDAAEAWLKLRDWQHTLANELRKASGQPIQD
ncbi:DUF1906 domain-containing protein [Paenibacillus naphthalenovorans]|uniref:DUF1906 domain-containing protein n=1 Tax=Paenibacillus naphthalenovorans TaxID=162209 RepID=UPI00088D0C0C|nr:DUF1906 domain-containing protein [Paenibacillus naphthalenovorans]SDI48696.1 protein of unknown function [Paenibacillus naphthalenovorans]